MIAGLASLALAGLATVDARVQEAVDRLLEGRAAKVEAVVVVEVATGRVIARGGRLDRPLPPGSTFKLVDVLAAGANRPAALAGTVHCAGRARQSGRDVKCWRPSGHGDLTLEEAIPESCNIYFGALGEQVGTPALVAAARALGVGTGAGRLPDASFPAALVADGEGVLVTARQLAQLARQIALGRRADGAPIASPEVLSRLRRGMRAAVEHGTATGAASSIPVAGKTGSAAFGGGLIGWFVGYAPADEPTVAIAIARKGAMGRETARGAPPIFEAFFHGR